MDRFQSIAAAAADLIETGHWAAASLRSAFSYAAFGPGAWRKPEAGGYPDYEAIMAFERHWLGARSHLSDGTLASLTAADMAARVGPIATVEALRSYARH